MDIVIRFFHVRHNNSPRGGATVRVSGPMDGGPVSVQIAYCSPNDQFCRKTGRDAAEKAVRKTIPLKGLPALLHKVSKKVLRKSKWMPVRDLGDHGSVTRQHQSWRLHTELYNRDWTFATKYWTAKKDGHGGGSGGAPAEAHGEGLGVLLRKKLEGPHFGEVAYQH